MLWPWPQCNNGVEKTACSAQGGSPGGRAVVPAGSKAVVPAGGKAAVPVGGKAAVPAGSFLLQAPCDLFKLFSTSF